MATGKLLSDVILPAANALAGGLVIGLALLAFFAAVGRMLLVFRRRRARLIAGTHGPS
ncbi:MAG TPA: hypothetical protein VFZ27_10180 [Terriglobia bacterium]|nr:hypothetical protein [Terriglobia bacterium]